MNLYKNNSNRNNNTKDYDITICKNMYGFCLNYYDNQSYELRNLIHNYGCQHLQLNMPLVLNNAIMQANDKDDPEVFLSCIKLEFQIFSTFVDNLKNT